MLSQIIVLYFSMFFLGLYRGILLSQPFEIMHTWLSEKKKNDPGYKSNSTTYFELSEKDCVTDAT